MAKLTIKDLLEAGVHFGHQKKRWNPKMKEFVYGFKNGISIIDLTKTMRQIGDAINFLQHTVQKGGRILFVGTKRQAQQVIKEAAEKTGMFYVTDRWLGGTLTNNVTIRQSVKKMETIDAILNSPSVSGMKKKELASLRRQSYRLHRNLDGIYEMTKLPDVLFVVDVSKEYIAVNEARKLNIPIVAIIDTDSDPDPIDYPITSNDDAVRSIGVIVDVITEAIKEVAEIYTRKVEEEAGEEKKKTKAKQPDNKKGAVKKEGKEEGKKSERKEEVTEDKKEEDIKKPAVDKKSGDKPEQETTKTEEKEEETETDEKKEKEAKEKKKTVTKKKTTARKKKTTAKDKEESAKDEKTPVKKKTVRKRKTTKKETEEKSEDVKKEN